MKMMKKYACLYDGIQFTEAEQAELGKFAMALMKAASDDNQDAMNRLFIQALKDVDELGAQRIAGFIEFASLFEKDADAGLPSTGMSLSQALGTAAIPISLGLAAAPMIMQGIRSWMQGSAIKDSLKKIYQMHPELKNDPNIPMYFQAIVDFAPAVAKNPLIAGNLLSQWHMAGGAMAQPEIIKMLVGIQKDVSEHARMGGSAAAGEFGRASLPAMVNLAKVK